MKVVILVFIGIPATGKSTLARQLFNDLNLKEFTFIHVCYDELLPPSSWEVPHLNQWKLDRQKVFNEVHALVKSLVSEQDCHSFRFSQIWREAIEIQKPVVLIIDDNMYYRSMRHSYYRLAKEYSISFCQVYFETNLEAAIERNSTREGLSFVPVNVIRNISQNLEPPSIQSNWEKFFVTIPACADLSKVSEQIKSLLETSLLNPQVPCEVNEPHEHSMNITHIIDLALRKIISRKVLSAKNTLKGNDLKNLNVRFIERKKTILSNLKKGLVLLPQDLCDNTREDLILQFVETLLDC